MDRAHVAYVTMGMGKSASSGVRAACWNSVLVPGLLNAFP